MAYKALYRKWRPDTFDTVIGQAHITETIRNEIISSHIAHAYLFTGTRGTGKTSTAKILSRAVNCLEPNEGNPCNKCENCQSILNELNLDVLEIDAASNTGVDNIRDIIEQLNYLPTSGKYKVYIIDEVHMLSQGAFNALLKTLEEPPSHVIFILATTEVQKIPATILSRCQRFDFKTISIYDIVSNIKKILIGEGIEADEDALEYVAFLGDGSMRDSLSILDQCLAFKSNNLTLSDVTNTVGTVDDAVLYDFATDISENNLNSAMSRFNALVNSGKNFDNIVKGLLQTFREILMFKINADEYCVSKLKKSMLKNCAERFCVSSLVKYIDILTDTISSFKTFSSQRVLLECALIKLCTPMVNTDTESLLSRIDRLEARLSFLEKNPPVASAAKHSEDELPPMPDYDIPMPEAPDYYENEGKDDLAGLPQTKADTSGVSGELNDVITRWNEVTTAISLGGKLRIFTALFDVKPQIEDGKLILNVADEDNKKLLGEKANKAFIIDTIKQVLGLGVDIVINSDTYAVQGGGNDIFHDLGNIEKNFPSNIRID